MKKIFKRSFARSLSFLALLIMVSSCQKQNEAPDPVEAPATFTLHKDIVVSSEDGQNALTVRVSTDDQSILDSYSAANFEITPVPEGESHEEVMEAKYPLEPSNDKIEEKIIEEESESDKVALSFQVIDRKKAPGIASIGLSFIAAETGSERLFGWKNATIYSPIGNIRRAYIRQTSLVFPVGFGLKARDTNNDPYYTVISNYSWLFGIGESVTQTFPSPVNRCYFTIKCRLLGHYQILFE